MKILLINTFFHICGGTETYFFNLANLLKKNGHDVVYFAMHHPDNYPTEFSKYFVSYKLPSDALSFRQKIKLILSIFFPFEARRKIRQLIQDEKPDIAHIHNIFPQFSHSVIIELKRKRIPIVTTLHDFSYICPSRCMFDGNNICSECEDARYYKMLFKSCFLESRVRTLIVMIYSYFYYKVLRIQQYIDLYISPSEFLISRYKANRFFANKNILCLPYFIDTQDYRGNFNNTEESIIYFGRLDKIKGVDILIEAVKGLGIKLKIIGIGPYEDRLKKIVIENNIKEVEFLGFRGHPEIHSEIAASLFSVVPSIWYDNYPYAIIESFALGKPVIASNLGGMPELVRDGITGYLFEVGNAGDLREKILNLLNDRDLIVRLGKTAREWIIENLNPDNHYKILIKEYRNLLSIG